MRILIKLTAAVLAATTAVASADPGEGGEPPCRPMVGATVWDWPLAPGAAQQQPAAAPIGPAAPSVPTAMPPGGPTMLRGFEPPVHRWEAGHRGVDLAGSVGAAVVAAGAGTVLFAGRVADQGVVVVGHGALRTSYEPVEASVVVGAHVVTGQRIGALDAGHCAQIACLHWGLLAGHGHAVVYYDPLLLLGCGGVRLEPMDEA
jgi:murein DD-endopeptidase MepM/ murein hydrolase activator NlpD